MKILVTGAAGFIGSHLTDALLKHDDTVVGVDNLSGGRLANLETARRDGSFTFIESSVTAAVRRLRDERFDQVYHLAAHVGARTVRHDPYHLLTDAVSSAFAVLRIARECAGPIVLVSSSEVYGSQSRTPFSEEAFCVIGPPSVPRWSYAIAKLWTEQLAVAAWCQYGIRTVVPRLFNVTGPRQRADTGMVVPSFACAALGGQELRIHGDGRQQRCFAHVGDIVNVLMTLPFATALYGHVVNVGAATPISVRQVATDIAAHVWQRYGKASRITEVPHDPQDGTDRMPVRIPDTSRLEAATGLRVPSRWPDIVSDVCAYWASTLGIRALLQNRKEEETA